MILSHRNRFIFLKTVKTAGTSFEIALAKYCGPDDIITPITESDEELRKKLDHRTAQNYRKPLREILKERRRADLNDLLQRQWPLKYWNHMSAEDVKQRVGDDVWREFPKITIVRNPYDRIVSYYFFAARNKQSFPSFHDWVMSHLFHLVRNHRVYTLNGELVADHVIRFEEFPADIARLEKSIPGLTGLADTFASIKAKANYRPSRGTVVSMFAGQNELREMVRLVCRYEIQRFNYEFPE